MTRILGITLTVVACLALTQQASAGGGGTPSSCGGCGCGGPCQRKVCQVVCGTKTITKYCWCVECEEFCAPLPGCRPCSKTVTCDVPTCADGGCCDPCVDGCCDPCGGKRSCFSIPMAVPKCGPVRCRKVLVKKEYTCEVPVYECVVKYLCPDCCAAEEEAVPKVEQEPAPPLPPAPSKQAYRPIPLPGLYGAP